MRAEKIILSLLIFGSIAFAGDMHRLELFVMSKCPYGTQAETQIFNLISQHSELTDEIDIEIHYILDYDSSSESFRSLHGQKEVDEDTRQIIIRKYYPDKFWCYLMSKNSHYQDTLWVKDAEMCGINPEKLSKYIKKSGYTLTLSEAHLTDSLNVNASPTILLDGVKVRDWRGDLPTLYTMLQNLLVENKSKMKCEKDVECPPKAGYISSCVDGKCKYTEAPLVTLKIITLDTTRYGSSTFSIVRFLREETGNLKTTYVPYGDDKSKDILRKVNDALKPEYAAGSSSYNLTKGDEKPVSEIKSLPVYIISYNINKYPSFNHFGSYLIPCELDGDSVYIADPNTYPARALLDRDEKPGKLDLFIMSKCPFSKAVEESLLAKDFSGLDIDSITLHFVIRYDSETGKFESFHGRPELVEDKRQIIIQKYFNEKLWDYIHCYNISSKSDSCIKSLNLNPKDIDEKIRKYADSLLKDDFNLSDGLKIKSTPTVLIDNRYILRNSNDIQKYFKIILESGRCGN